MDWKKVERVRQAIERGDYTHPAFLDSSIETDFERFYVRLLGDMNEPTKAVRARSVRLRGVLAGVFPGSPSRVPCCAAD